MGTMLGKQGVLDDGKDPKKVTQAEWRDKLTPEQFYVTRQKGTERPFTGLYVNHHEQGTYKCICCGLSLFDSDTKFDSKSGWPSFYNVKEKDNVKCHMDESGGMVRVEVLCKGCEAHLGHVFNDGPKPTGERYCINSASLSFDTK